MYSVNPLIVVTVILCLFKGRAECSRLGQRCCEYELRKRATIKNSWKLKVEVNLNSTISSL